MESKGRSFYNLVTELSNVIKERRHSSQPDQLNEDWTKKALIVPLLEGLGWGKGTEITCEFGPHSNEDGLDLILNCQSPIGIEIKTLYELPPQNIEHPQIQNGLRQCKAKEAPYFIWTNGDCWQFFSLSLMNAPFFQVYLSDILDDVSLLDKLLIIKKDAFISNPERFNKAVSKNMKIMALYNAWTEILQDRPKELLQVFRKGLQHVDIKDEVILKFLKTFKSEDLPSQVKSPISFRSEGSLPKAKSQISFKSEGLLSQGISPISSKSEGLLHQGRSPISSKSEGLLHQGRSPIWVPKPINWEHLIDSYQSPYRLARWFFRTSYYRKLGEYLISENYKPWSKDLTWRHIGLPDGKNEGKKVRHAVILFQEWGFIKEAGADKYCRVEECAPYLKKLLEKTSLA